MSPGRAVVDTSGLIASGSGRPVDESGVPEDAVLPVATLAEHRRRVNVDDLWIAASAVAHRLPIVTQDDDFADLEGVRGLVVVKV